MSDYGSAGNEISGTDDAHRSTTTDAVPGDDHPFPAPVWDDAAGLPASRIAECDDCGYRGPEWAMEKHDHTPCQYGEVTCDGPGSLRTCRFCRRE